MPSGLTPCLELVDQLPRLRDVVVLQLETASASAELQLAVARHFLYSVDLGRSQRKPHSMGGESKAILASSLSYVTCWLGGMEFKASLRRCVPRKPFHDPSYRLQPNMLAAENAWRLRRIAREREVEARLFGYTFDSFLALLQPHAQHGSCKSAYSSMHLQMNRQHSLGLWRNLMVAPSELDCGPTGQSYPSSGLDRVTR